MFFNFILESFQSILWTHIYIERLDLENIKIKSILNDILVSGINIFHLFAFEKFCNDIRDWSHDFDFKEFLRHIYVVPWVKVGKTTRQFSGQSHYHY